MSSRQSYQDELLDRVIELQAKHVLVDLGYTVSVILEALAYVLGRIDPEGTSRETSGGGSGSDADGVSRGN